MATTWADVISAAMVQIDDVQLQDQLAASPAQFYRRMAALVQQAMALLVRPPALREYLKNGMSAPLWSEAEWVSTAESMADETSVDTGQAGFDLCSVVQVVNDNGMVAYLPYTEAQYDADTGTIVFPVQQAEEIVYAIDFYTDGSFPDLSNAQIRLFALAIAVIWDERFSRNWLNMQPKIKDDSFSTVNEANYTEKITKRLHDNRIAFNDELRAYEQACAYATTMKYHGSTNMELV